MNPQEYQQATQNAALINPCARAWLEIKGADARKFLNGLLTNNIQTLQGSNGFYACICTPKGKMIADLYCYACGDYFGIDCDTCLRKTVFETLKRYIIFQKVTVEDHSDKWSCLGIIGPKSEETLKKFFTALPKNNHEYGWEKVGGIGVWFIHKKRWGLDGFELWVKKEKAAALKSKFRLTEISQETQEILRIESATPKFGVDMDEHTIPQEANLYEALSFTKGCYVGQEIIARLEHRGHVGKQLRLFKMSGGEPPSRGEKIFTTMPESQEEIGLITSSCFSPKHHAPIALGYIRYNFLNLSDVKTGKENARIIAHR